MAIDGHSETETICFYETVPVLSLRVHNLGGAFSGEQDVKSRGKGDVARNLVHGWFVRRTIPGRIRTLVRGDNDLSSDSFNSRARYNGVRVSIFEGKLRVVYPVTIKLPSYIPLSG